MNENEEFKERLRDPELISNIEKQVVFYSQFCGKLVDAVDPKLDIKPGRNDQPKRKLSNRYQMSRKSRKRK